MDSSGRLAFTPVRPSTDVLSFALPPDALGLPREVRNLVAVVLELLHGDGAVAVLVEVLDERL